MEKLETIDIQGLIISGYGHLSFSSYHFLRFSDPTRGREWLDKIVDRVTHAEWRPKGQKIEPKSALNIAFTAAGLEVLGLPKSSLDSFPQEFCEGMSDPLRAVRLGDIGQSDPKNWDFGYPADQIHALLILQAGKQAELDVLDVQDTATYKSFGVEQVISPIVGEIHADEQEHFGFRDSISQPLIEGAPNHHSTGVDVIKAGEFILGYPNEYGVLPPSPTLEAQFAQHPCMTARPVTAGNIDFGRNGSFLVVRKLAQNVAAFNRLIAGRAKDDPADTAWLAAKFVGRWKSGAPLVLAPNADDPTLGAENDFSYLAGDPHGFACPVGAHVRRTNPRDSLPPTAEESYRTARRHRIMRRGVSYGDRLNPPGSIEDDRKPRGLLFICVNADIERQFEFIQQSWVNDPKFNGLDNEPDPLIGPTPDLGVPASSDDGVLTIQGEPVRRRLNGIQRFVTVKGGDYFFLPSICSLRTLAYLTR